MFMELWEPFLDVGIWVFGAILLFSIITSIKQGKLEGETVPWKIVHTIMIFLVLLLPAIVIGIAISFILTVFLAIFLGSFDSGVGILLSIVLAIFGTTMISGIPILILAQMLAFLLPLFEAAALIVARTWMD